MSHIYDNTLFSVFTLSVFYNLAPSKNGRLLSSLQTAVCSLPAWSERVLVCLEINRRFAKFLCFLLFVITTKQVHLLYQQPNLDGVLFTSKYYWNTKQLTVISLSLCVWVCEENWLDKMHYRRIATWFHRIAKGVWRGEGAQVMQL